MAAVRRASVVWEGNLVQGKGTITETTSTAMKSLPVTWASRTEAPDGRTSPEELVAAAHASCFAMAFSHKLNENKTPPKRLDVSASVTFDKVAAGWKVTRSELTVKGVVPGLDAAGFQKIAEAAKDGCPISGAMKGNVDLSVQATHVPG